MSASAGHQHGMPLPDGIAVALGAEVRSTSPVSGGDLAEASRVEFADGSTAFVKTAADAAPGSFEAEAAGLRWLRAADAITVPEVLGVGEDWLALEWTERGGPLDEAALGHGLARLHRAGADEFGELAPDTPGGDDPPLRLGPLEIPSPPSEEWPAFYAEHRVLPMAKLAADRASLDPDGAEAIDQVCARIDSLAGPAEAPSRLHGDLWSGNVMAGAHGRPVLIDPAAYGGHREIDLAMLELFGSPGDDFYAAYEDVERLAPEHEERVALWQLFPLLVHAALFGGGYGAQAAAAARRYL